MGKVEGGAGARVVEHAALERTTKQLNRRGRVAEFLAGACSRAITIAKSMIFFRAAASLIPMNSLSRRRAPFRDCGCSWHSSPPEARSVESPSKKNAGGDCRIFDSFSKLAAPTRREPASWASICCTATPSAALNCSAVIPSASRLARIRSPTCASIFVDVDMSFLRPLIFTVGFIFVDFGKFKMLVLLRNSERRSLAFCRHIYLCASCMKACDFLRNHGTKPAAHIALNPTTKSRRQVAVIGTLLLHMPRRHVEC